MIRTCSVCGEEFDPSSPAKLRAGGYVHQCPDCSSEEATKVVGFQSGDGKTALLEILEFDSDEDRQRYMNWRRVASGMHKGKDCQLDSNRAGQPGIAFRIVSQDTSTNHKGRANG